MTTLFISDLHLDESRPHITRLFLEFLDRDASRADALYILGDLFEAWIGDDAPGDVGDQVAAGLARSQIRINGETVLLMHGDVLCVDDAPYQAFRKETRTPAWQRGFLSQPIAERARFAEQARAESKRYTRSVADAITDVNQEAVMSAFEHHATRRIIHGHTHRPAVHRLDAGETSIERIVLGDWYEQGSVLRVDAERIELAAL